MIGNSKYWCFFFLYCKLQKIVMNFTFINKWSIRDLPVIVTTTHYSFKVWCQCSNFYEIISYKPFICVWAINFYNFLIKAPLCGLLIVISRSILWSACPSNIFSPLVLVWLIPHSHSANGQRINRDLDYSPLNVLLSHVNIECMLSKIFNSEVTLNGIWWALMNG